MTDEPFWTPARVAILEQMIEVEGFTYVQTAKQLGTTKDACIGKAHRLGLKPRPGTPLSPGQISRYKAEKPEPQTTAQRLDALDIFPRTGCCVFPIGHPGRQDFHFCGARCETVGASYCDRHHRVIYVPEAVSKAQREAWTEERRIKTSLRMRERMAKVAAQ